MEILAKDIPPSLLGPFVSYIVDKSVVNTDHKWNFLSGYVTLEIPIVVRNNF